MKETFLFSKKHVSECFQFSNRVIITQKDHSNLMNLQELFQNSLDIEERLDAYIELFTDIEGLH